MNEFIHHLRRVCDLGISTDVAGLIGDPYFAIEFWRLCFQAIGEKPNFGVEYLSWERLVRKDGLGYVHAGDRVIGHHGLTGDDRSVYEDVLDAAKLQAISVLITDTHELMHIVKETVQRREKRKREKDPHKQHQEQMYVLTHEPEAMTKLDSIKKLLSQEKFKNVVWAIENHPSKGSFERTLKLVSELSKEGINVILVFDIVHYFRELDEGLTYQQKWLRMYQTLRKISVELGSCIVHVPIGLLQFDSLEIDKVTNSMWRDFGDYMYGMKNFPILEHQLQGPPQLYFDPNTQSKAYLNSLWLQGIPIPAEVVKRTSGLLEVIIKNKVIMRPRMSA